MMELMEQAAAVAVTAAVCAAVVRRGAPEIALVLGLAAGTWVLLSVLGSLEAVASLRELTATIVFESLQGIRVPKEAVHLDEDGDSFVYILEGLQAAMVYVDVIAEDGDYYMVEETGDGLRVGDQIITRANDLYDGAVVVD